MSASSRLRARIALPIAALLGLVGVGLAVSPANADTTVSDYAALSAAVADPETSGPVVALDSAIDGSSQELVIPASSTLTLDLFGHDLSLRQLTLGEGANFTLTDTSTGTPGELTVASSFSNEGGIRTTAATLTIGGSIIVVSTAGASVAGIGGGDSTTGGTLLITDEADVTATGGSNAAGIGGGELGGGGGVTIKGDAIVHATGGTNGAGIGGGRMTNSGSVTILENADVHATGGSSGAGVGGGENAGGGTTLIGGAATVAATGGPGGAGIGANGTAGNQSITIEDAAAVTAAGGSGQTVGIGSAWGFGGDVIFDDDAVVTATAGSTGFGIGTGTAAHTADIDILSEAHVTASGGLGSIGGGDDAFGSITVNGELTVPSGKLLALPTYLDAITGTGSLTGAGTVVNNGSISLPDANVTANVTVRNYSIAVALAGGTVTPAVSSIRVLSATMYLSGRTFPAATRNGYVLTGWKNGTSDFTEQSIVTNNSVTVTAQWSAYPATVPTPTVSGQAKVGQQLAVDVHDAGWSAGTTYSYSWLRNGVAIAGTNSDTYTVKGADLAAQLSVKVTGVNPAQPTVAKTSAKTAKVIAGTLPGNDAQISGDYLVGGTVFSNPSSGETTAKFSYQWYADGVAISKATTRDWVVTSVAAGKLLSVRVTVSAVGYTSVPLVALSNTPISLADFALPPTPTITGVAQTGQKLTAVPGVWSPKATFSYQWYRDADPVPGATASTLVLPTTAKGSSWTVRVTGSAPGYRSSFGTSAPTSATLGTLTGATPKITGTAKVGKTLTAVPGVWTPGTTLAYQWVRVSGTTSTDIPGAASPTYLLAPADKGKTIRVRVTGSQSDYGNLAKLSAATAKIG